MSALLYWLVAGGLLLLASLGWLVCAWWTSRTHTVGSVAITEKARMATMAAGAILGVGWATWYGTVPV